MLKRAITAIQRRFFSGLVTQSPEEEGAVRAARRNFFTKATLGAASITGTAGLAKLAVDSIPQPGLQDLYTKDAHNGEQELLEREYVVMSEREKADMVQMFVDNYSDKS